jgi:glutamate N-acetyltransferase/amino-acid N-acetyltransferase
VAEIKAIEGGICAAQGFAASGVTAGIKKSGKPDLGVVRSESPCAAAGTFTTNAVRASCVDWCEQRLPSDTIRAICCNSGNANACTGQRGVRDTAKMASLTGSLLGAAPDSVLVASTGVIGDFLPMEKVEAGIGSAVEGAAGDGGEAFAKAIMTTDLVSKEAAVKVTLDGGEFVVGGCAKGSGMIHPNMATMLAFVTTDAKIAPKILRAVVKEVVDATFNCLTVDGDTSTNDMVLVLANGQSGVSAERGEAREAFRDALYRVCNELCQRIAADGEGASKRVEVRVRGGSSGAQCRTAAKAIAGSNLVKTALFGNDPNWGRILCAIGYSGAEFARDGIRVSLCGVPVFAAMRPAAFDGAALSKRMASEVVVIEADLGMGGGEEAVAHTCDLTYDYIKINAEYHT